jgi:hypothetical protein
MAAGADNLTGDDRNAFHEIAGSIRDRVKALEATRFAVYRQLSSAKRSGNVVPIGDDAA